MTSQEKLVPEVQKLSVGVNVRRASGHLVLGCGKRRAALSAHFGCAQPMFNDVRACPSNFRSAPAESRDQAIRVTVDGGQSSNSASIS